MKLTKVNYEKNDSYQVSYIVSRFFSLVSKNSRPQTTSLTFENCFSDIKKFILTHENDQITPSVVNCLWHIRQQLTDAGSRGS